MLKHSVVHMNRPERRRVHQASLAWAENAVAAMEFGLLAPVMALLIVGVFDISKIAILWEQVWSASRSVAESASTLALPVTPGGPNYLTWQNADVSLSATFAEIPWLAAGIATGDFTTPGNLPGNSMVAVLTGVNYGVPANCKSSCTYAPVVIWSKAYKHIGFNSTSSVLRSCGSTLSQVAPGAPINTQAIATQSVSSTLVSASISVPDPFFVADVSIKYMPFFFNFITGPVTLSATSYVPARTSNPGATTNDWPILLEDGDPAANSGSECGGQ